jgi:hypothetical protein
MHGRLEAWRNGEIKSYSFLKGVNWMSTNPTAHAIIYEAMI